jgi:hypothetical protein
VPDRDNDPPVHCTQCGRLIDRQAGETVYTLVPEHAMEKAIGGRISPWAVRLCAACYDAESR